MCRVWPAILARAGEGDALLVAGELDELAELLLREHLQGPPEKLNVLVGLHQPHLVHGVRLFGGKEDLLTTQPLERARGVRGAGGRLPSETPG